MFNKRRLKRKVVLAQMELDLIGVETATKQIQEAAKIAMPDPDAANWHAIGNQHGRFGNQPGDFRDGRGQQVTHYDLFHALDF